MKKQFVTVRRDTGLVSVYQIHWMEESFRKLGFSIRTAQKRKATEDIAKGLAKIGALRRIARVCDTLSVVPVNGLAEYITFPVCYFNEIVTCAFDCWPDRYADWVAFFRRHRPLVAFLSAKASVEYMRRQCPDLHFEWAPEATNPDAYDDHIPMEARKIDVLELGRRSDVFHEQVRSALAADGKVHRYEHIKGEKIFGSGRQPLVEGLADSKIMVCFPATMTHSYAGGVETMTQRYLDAMASGCLPVGHAPAELIELFGYNPVVEVDMDAAADHVRSILAHIGDWNPLVERNRVRLREVGSWDVRARTICEIIDQRLRARQGEASALRR